MSWRTKLRALFRKEKLDAEMSEEMRAHLELQTERNISRGMSADDARFAARREFGGVEQIKERARDQRGFIWLDHAWQDLRYAWRHLVKHPGFTIVVVISLALGIGVNSAVFSRVNDQLLKMLPVRNPGELVLFQWIRPAKGGGPRSDGGDNGADNIDQTTGRAARRVFPRLLFERFRAQPGALSDVFAVAPIWGVRASVNGEAEMIGGCQAVSGNYFTALGVHVFLGRALNADDDRPAAAPVAVISCDFWQARFGGDPAAVGKTIVVNQTTVTVVGVTSPESRATMGDVLTLPLAAAALIRGDGKNLADPGYWWLRIMGRLKPGATPEQARASLAAIFDASARETMRIPDPNDPPKLGVVAGGYSSTERERQQLAGPLRIQFGLAALVLLAACVNVANLLLARGAARRREFAVRLALGASRGRIVRQLLAESTLLALLGAAISAVLGLWGFDLLSIVAVNEPTPSIDWRVLGFTTVVAVVTSIGAGLVPALRTTRLDLTAEFQGSARSLGGGSSRLNRGLLVVQVALALVLLIGAGLFVRTVRNLRAIDVGFDRTHLLLFGLDGATAGYTNAQTLGLYQTIADRIAALPGVRAVTYASWPFFASSSGPTIGGLEIPGYVPAPGESVSVKPSAIAPNFFATYQLPIVAGRAFDARDSATSQPVAVINQTFVRKYFRGENPIGRHIGKGREAMEIVGVVRDAKQQSVRAPTLPTLFTPFAQAPGGGGGAYTVRMTAELATVATEIRAAVRAIDRSLPIANMRTQDAIVDGAMLRTEVFFARMSVLIGLLAVALACVGLYGLMSYTVYRRTGEIGLRMALGAMPRTMLWMILRDSLAVICVGVVVGIAGAAAASRLIAASLYDLSPTDPLTYGSVALMLVSIATLACLLPARRAAKVDPMIALRAE